MPDKRMKIAGFRDPRSALFQIEGGPFVAESARGQPDAVSYLCGSCGKVTLILPANVSLRSVGDLPVIAICYACGAYNEVPMQLDS